MKKIAFGILIVIALTAAGCATYVRTAPPAARVEVRTVPPGPLYIWIDGHWKRMHSNWVWVPGHWKKRPAPAAHWVPGHWKKTRFGWKWVPGHWERR